MNERRAPFTLAIDIGGSGIKALLLDAAGRPAGERRRVATPRPPTPAAVLRAIVKLAAETPGFDRVSVGFPGVVIDGVVRRATNLHPAWIGVHLPRRMQAALGKPVRVGNDADVQGLGVVEGRGVELVITLGTGVGAALFLDGRLVPNLEMGLHPLRKNKSYEDLLGERARRRAGKRVWNKRLAQAVERLEATFNYRRLWIGGGNARHIEAELPPNVTVVENLAGLLGGIRLWDEGGSGRHRIPRSGRDRRRSA